MEASNLETTANGGQDVDHKLQRGTHLTAMICSADRRVFKFWSLLAFGLLAFAGWLALFSWCAHVVSGTEVAQSFGASGYGDSKDNSALVYVDVWFALAIMAAFDAFAIVLNFNRSLIHQFHYYVSLRMTTLAFVVASAVRLLSPSPDRPLNIPFVAAVLLGCAAVYAVIFLITERLHRLLPVRGLGMASGSLDEFSDHISSFDIPWPRALLYAAINGGVGFALTTLVPSKFAMLNPIVHITWYVPSHRIFPRILIQD